MKLKYVWPGLFLLCWLSTNAEAGLFGPNNYWECILKNVQGIANNQVTRVVVRQCRSQFRSNKSRSRRAKWFGPKTAEQCFVAYAKDTPSRRASDLIRTACGRLYPRR